MTQAKAGAENEIYEELDALGRREKVYGLLKDGRSDKGPYSYQI